MFPPETAATQALIAAKETITRAGFVEHLQALVRDVWNSCVDRYEPDELGDTPMSLGIQAVENLKTRALRRAEHDPSEPEERHWRIHGLGVSTPQNVLTIHLNQLQLVSMKATLSQGRRPDWTDIPDWHQLSQTRHALALRNSTALGGHFSTPLGQDPLFNTDPKSRGRSGGAVVRDFMWLWAGDLDTGRTAGWLAVPVLGEQPFAAIEPLWWDETSSRQQEVSVTPAAGPGFDQRPQAVPVIALRPRAIEEIS